MALRTMHELLELCPVWYGASIVGYALLLLAFICPHLCLLFNPFCFTPLAGLEGVFAAVACAC